ncbi:LLM class oxidoreductase [Achromobacter xylosoxidans]
MDTPHLTSKYIATSAQPPIELDLHPGFKRVFQPDQLSVGLILPLETHRGKPAPTMANHVEMAQHAEALGFAALWMRDVPFFDPEYGDVAQVFEPMVYIGYLAAATRRIALGTTGIVLPTHEPMYLAKQATSLDQLSNGRMILGLSSGDRQSDYPMLNIDYDSRGERFRDAYSVLRTLSEKSFPSFHSKRFGGSDGKLNLIPKPPYGRTPAIAVGTAQQSMEWLAENMDGLVTGVVSPERLPQLVCEWSDQVNRQGSRDEFKPIALGGYLELSADPDESFQRIRGGFRAGRNGLVAYLNDARNAGITHVALNPKVSRQPYTEVMAELAEFVLPHFPTRA